MVHCFFYNSFQTLSMLLVLLTCMVGGTAWKQFGNEIVNDIMSAHGEVSPTCWTVREIGTTVEIVFHSPCSIPELVFVPSLPINTTVRVTFETGARLKHLSLCDILSFADYYVDGHNAPENILVELPYAVHLPYTRNRQGQVNCGSDRERRTEFFAHSRRFNVDTGHASREAVTLHLPSDYLAGSLLFGISYYHEITCNIVVDGFDPTTPSVLFQTSSSEFMYNAIYIDGMERTDLFPVLFQTTERDILPKGTTYNAIRFMQKPDESAEECVLLQSSPQVWSNDQCFNSSSTMTLQPRGDVTLPSSMESWRNISIQYPTKVRVDGGSLKAQELDLTHNISTGVAMIPWSPVFKTVVIDRNQPHFIVEDIQFAELSIPKVNSIDTSQVLFYGSYKDNALPKGLVAMCKTRFYHADFNGYEDCSCVFDGEFNHLDCDYFTRNANYYYKYGLDLTLRSDIHQDTFRYFRTLTVENDVEIAVGFDADTLDLTDRSVTLKSSTKPTTMFVSSRTRITLAGGFHTLIDVKTKTRLDSLPEPLFTVDGHAVLYFKKGNVLASECMLLARITKGSSLYVDSPINVVFLKDSFYIHSPYSSTCSFRDELKHCFSDPTLCDTFFYHPEQSLVYNDYKLEWDLNDKIVFEVSASQDTIIIGNNITARGIDYFYKAHSVVVKGDVHVGRITGEAINLETDRCSLSWIPVNVDNLTLGSQCTQRIIPKRGNIKFAWPSIKLGLGWSQRQSLVLKHDAGESVVEYRGAAPASNIETDIEIVDVVGGEDVMVLMEKGMVISEGHPVVGCFGTCSGRVENELTTSGTC